MMTILGALSGINAYPIPQHTIECVAARRGLSLSSEFTASIGSSAEYLLAEADLLEWLATAPDISQGGQSYSFTDEQRTFFRNRAAMLRKESGEGINPKSVIYGYKGSRL